MCLADHTSSFDPVEHLFALFSHTDQSLSKFFGQFGLQTELVQAALVTIVIKLKKLILIVVIFSDDRLFGFSEIKHLTSLKVEFVHFFGKSFQSKL
jgi:hypothetical protein